MDEHRPIWRTGWYWKQVFLRLFIPLTLVLSLLAALKVTHHLSQREFNIAGDLITWLSTLAFGLWMSSRSQKLSKSKTP